jgi:hypothetical protein
MTLQRKEMEKEGIRKRKWKKKKNEEEGLRKKSGRERKRRMRE